MSDQLVEKEKNEISIGGALVKNALEINGYLFITFTNGQKILTNNEKTYDVSEYTDVFSIFEINNRLCAHLGKFRTGYIINLNTNEVLLEDDDISYVNKFDNLVIKVTPKSRIASILFNIETKKYINEPDGYEFEFSPSENFYTYIQKDPKYETDFYDKKRIVLNGNGEVLLENITGWIYKNDSYLYVVKEKEIAIVEMKDDGTSTTRVIKKEGQVLGKPEYYNGNIIVLEEGAIKVYGPKLELKNELKIDDLKEVLDVEKMAETYKIIVSHYEDGKQINKSVFVNLLNGNTISHLRIESFPYWNPNCYIAYDNAEYVWKKADITTDATYYFYNKDMELTATAQGYGYNDIENEAGEIYFFVYNHNGNILINPTNGAMAVVEYINVEFPARNKFGFGINAETQTLDFFDKNLHVVYRGFPYDKYKVYPHSHNMGYTVLNGYLFIRNYFIDDYCLERIQSIILSADGEEILNSIHAKCHVVGNLIQISDENGISFFNTLNGEIKQLNIDLPMQDGKIIMDRVLETGRIISNEDYTKLLGTVADSSVTRKRKIQNETNPH